MGAKAWLLRRRPLTFLSLGLVLRELFSFWTGHPWDMEVWLRNAYYVAGGVDPYRSLPPLPGLSFAYLDPPPITSVGYLPLWPLILASLYRLYLLGSVQNRFLLYFLLKQPAILGDIVLGYVLGKAVRRWGGTPASSRGIIAFWMLFPYPILVSGIWGMFDSLVVVLWISSVLAAGALRKSSFLGLGILLKFLPLITLPYLLLREVRMERRSVLAGLGFGGVALAIPALFTILAFGLLSWPDQGLRAMLGYNAHGSPGGMTYIRVLGLPPLVPAVPQVLLFADGFAWVGGVALATVAALKLFHKGTPESLVQALLLITAAFLLTRWSVYEQYFLYLLPLLLVDVTLWHPERRGLFHVTWALGLAFMAINNLLFIRFLSPVVPTAFALDQFMDNTPPVAYVRYALLDAVGLLISLHLLQVAVVLVKPQARPLPWVIWPFLRSGHAKGVQSPKTRGEV